MNRSLKYTLRSPIKGIETYFGVDTLDQEMKEQTELYMVKVLATNMNEKRISFDELRTKMYKLSRER